MRFRRSTLPHDVRLRRAPVELIAVGSFTAGVAGTVAIHHFLAVLRLGGGPVAALLSAGVSFLQAAGMAFIAGTLIGIVGVTIALPFMSRRYRTN
jgi:hypothetical protein